MELKHVLGEIEADGANLVHERLLEWALTPPLWHAEAVGGRPHHQAQISQDKEEARAMPSHPETDCDLLVIGSGAGGLSAAVTAAWHELKVVVAEKEPVLGGTTAWSGGWMWTPLNPLAQRAGIVEDLEAPGTYLRHVLGNTFNEAKVKAFLEAAPRMVALFETHTALQFESGLKIPDTYGNVPGAGTGGRSVIAAPYDGRGLGGLIHRLRRPMRETTFMGMTIQAGSDLSAFMNVTRSPRAFIHAARRVSRHLIDLALYRRGMQLRNGLALVGRLLRSAADLGVELRTSSPAVRLLQDGGAVCGAVLSSHSRGAPGWMKRLLWCGRQGDWFCLGVSEPVTEFDRRPFEHPLLSPGTVAGQLRSASVPEHVR